MKKVLMALLFSTTESLSEKDVQVVISRYHEQAQSLPEEEEEESTNGSPLGQEVMDEVLAQVPTLVTTAQIRSAMREISTGLEESGAVYRLVEGPNGYRLAIHPDYADWVRLLRNEPRPQRLSPAALETLAVIAYRQPVTRAEMESIRGVSVDSALNRLLDRDLIRVVGRAELPGRPMEYGTTDAFLEYCGISSLDELPASDVLSPNEISAWIRQATLPKRPMGDAEMGLAEEGEEENSPRRSRDDEAGWEDEHDSDSGEPEEATNAAGEPDQETTR